MRVHDAGRDIWARHRNTEAEDRGGSSRHLVEGAPKSCVYHGACMVDGHSMPDAIGSSTPPHIKEPDADLVRSSFLAEQPSVRHEYYILILRSTASHVSILMDNEFALGNNHPTQIGHCGCEL